eukprot:scaffold14966_cov17-Tisochrysis_lutea.AAC.2
MERLLSKPDSRAAAITMLGKTLDLCPEKVRKAGTISPLKFKAEAVWAPIWDAEHWSVMRHCRRKTFLSDLEKAAATSGPN